MLLSPGRVGRAGVVTQRRAWSPSALFTFGEQGAWYDPSDINRYMTPSSTEIITNGNFGSGTTGWTAQAGTTFSVTGGVASVNGNVGFAGQSFTTVVGRWYQVTGTLKAGTGSGANFCGIRKADDPQNTINIVNVVTTNAVLTSDQTATAYFVATAATTWINIQANAATALADNISVREIPDIGTATLFQDAAGTTPVTAAEQPVGLILDKSKGLAGTQQIADPSFNTGIAGWGTQFPGSDVTFSWNSTNKSMSVTRGAGGTTGRPTYPVSVVAGTWYKITFTVPAASVNSAAFSIVDSFGATAVTNFGPQIITSATFVKFGQASVTGTVYLGLWCNNSTTAEFDSIEFVAVAGNHASQSTAGSRPLLSARYNLLTYSEQFDNAAWTKGNATIDATGVLAPDGTNTADKLRETAANAEHYLLQSVSTSAVPYTFSVYLKAEERTWANIYFTAGSFAKAYFDLANTAVGTVSTGVTASISNAGGGWRRCQITVTATAATFYAVVNTALGDNQSVSYAGTAGSGIYVWGADLRVANEPAALPAYQRVTTSTDYDTVGFPPYLRFDGTDDSLATASIDFSAGPTNPPLGPELITNGDFTNGTTGWTLGAGWSISDGAAVATAVASTNLASGYTTQAGKWYEASFTVRNYSSGLVRFLIGQTQTVNVGANGEYRYRWQAATGATVLLFAFNSFTATIDNVSVREVNAAYAPDKMTVFAGVRKLSDAGAYCVVELTSNSFSVDGGFALFAPYGTGAPEYSVFTRGTSAYAWQKLNTFTSPTTDVLSLSLDNSKATVATQIVSRVDARTPDIVNQAGPTSAGNFANAPLYIGRRGGSTNPFNGRLYSLIIRGAATSAADINNAEGYVETKTFGKDMNIVYVDEVTIGPTNELVTIGPSAEQVYVYQQYV